MASQFSSMKIMLWGVLSPILLLYMYVYSMWNSKTAEITFPQCNFLTRKIFWGRQDPLIPLQCHSGPFQALIYFLEATYSCRVLVNYSKQVKKISCILPLKQEPKSRKFCQALRTGENAVDRKTYQEIIRKLARSLARTV